MPKLGTTATKTAQLKCANLLVFRGFRRVLLVRVRPEIALITRPSNRAEKGKMTPSKKFATKPYHCVAGHAMPGRGKSPARQQCQLSGNATYQLNLSLFVFEIL
jgi:hypothetical protein